MMMMALALGRQRQPPRLRTVARLLLRSRAGPTLAAAAAPHRCISRSSFFSSRSAGGGSQNGTPLRHPEIRKDSKSSSSKGSSRFAAALLAAGTAAAAAATVSVHLRRTRRERIERELPLAADVLRNSSSSKSSSNNNRHHRPSLAEIQQTIQRSGLMGRRHRSVKEELDGIREWHTEHGFKGGLVVRDVTVPLFGSTDDKNESTEEEEEDTGGSGSSSSSEATTKEKNDNDKAPSSSRGRSWDLFDWFLGSSLTSVRSLEDILEDPLLLARRECYYLYYEITPTGQHAQHIFCRGTALGVDVLTCLEAWTVWDEELRCRVHRGFRNQADRVLADVVPLLAPPTDPRATVALAGHSLGGAVAAIVAAKLKRRGYGNVVALTTIGEPAYVPTADDAERFRQLLPAHHLRVENDRDFVPFLPPFSVHVGDKLWFPNYSTSDSLFSFLTSQAPSAPPPAPRYVADTPENAWTDSLWINFCVPEILMANGKPHRIPSYLERLDAMMATTIKDNEEQQDGDG